MHSDFWGKTFHEVIFLALTSLSKVVCALLQKKKIENIKLVSLIDFFITAMNGIKPASNL